MSKLIFVPKPFPEESPSSILRRLSDRHGHMYRTDLSHLYGSPYSGGSIAYRNHPHVQNLAKLIPFPDEVESFLNGFYPPLSNLTNRPSVNIYGLEVQSKMMRINTPAFCSECWKNGCEYFIKDLALAVYCPYHFRKYLTRCPTCGHNLAWQDLLSHGCRCLELPESPTCTAADAKIEQRLLKFFRTGDSDRFERFKRYLLLLGYERKNRCDCPATRNTVLLALALVDGDQRALLLHLNQLQRLYPEIPDRILCAKLAGITTPEARSSVRTFLRTKYSVATLQTGDVSPFTKFSLLRVQVTAWQKITSQERNMLRRSVDEARRYTPQQASEIARELLRSRLRNEFSRKKPLSGYTTLDVRRALMLPLPAIKGAVSEGILTPIARVRRQWFFNPDDVKAFSERYISIELFSRQTKTSTKKIRSALKRFESLDSAFTSQALRLRVISISKKNAVIAWLNRRELHPGIKNQDYNILPHLTDGQSGIWLSVSEVSLELDVHSCVVSEIIGAGLLKCNFRVRGGTGYAVNQTDVRDFKNKYIGAREARALLNCTLNTTTQTLKSLNVHPKTGPGINEYHSHFFLRAEVVSCAQTAEKTKSNHDTGYTIDHAIKKLNLSRLTIQKLIEQSALLKYNNIQSTSAYLNRESVDSFYEKHITTLLISEHLNIPTHCCAQLLARFNIFPVAGTQQISPKRHVYKLDHISSHFPEIKFLESTRKKLNESQLVCIAKILSSYNINATTFNIIFISSGFVHPLGTPKNFYLTKSDASRVSKILDEYFTYGQADKHLCHSRICCNLIKTGRLMAEYPLRPYTDHPMVKRDLVENYAIAHNSSKATLAS